MDGRRRRRPPSSSGPGGAAAAAASATGGAGGSSAMPASPYPANPPRRREDLFTGNVSRSCPRQRAGAQQPGDLVFDAMFEGGNLGRVELVDDLEYDLHVRPDTHNPKQRIWFHFAVTNAREGQRVIFNVVNLSKSKSLYRDGMTPLVRSSSRPQWERLPKQTVYYYRSPHHKKGYVMTFAFVFDSEAETYQFSYAYPYTFSRLQQYLRAIEQRKLSFVKRSQIGTTVQGRGLDLLTISSKKNLDVEASDRKTKKKLKVVFITGRVHPGETPSSFVCQGLIDFLVSDDPAAAQLRNTIVFKIVPMLNPDGVYHGNYRCSVSGSDLNRCWSQPTTWGHPTLVATKDYLMHLMADSGFHLDFYIDLHAHSTLSNAFFYGNEYEDAGRMKSQWVFPQLLASRAADFSTEQTLFNNDKSKAGTGRRSLGGILDVQAQCFTLEVSFFCYLDADKKIVPYTSEGYVELGTNLGRAFSEFYGPKRRKKQTS